MSEIRIKCGETLNLLLQFRRTAGGGAMGGGVDVAQIALSAQVQDAQDNLIAVLPLVKQLALGMVTGSAVDASRWPTGRLRCDLRAAFGGQVILSETFAIHVARSVTQS